jgi:phosphoglycolate phosphatase-like HAD superfamily hydrolase
VVRCVAARSERAPRRADVNGANAGRHTGVLLCDFDDTLVRMHHDQASWHGLQRRLVAIYRGAVPAARLQALPTDGYLAWYRAHDDASRRLGADAERLNRRAEEAVTDFERRAAPRATLLDGVARKLVELSAAGILLGIVSSNSTAVIRRIIGDLGLASSFCAVVGRAVPFSPRRVKPHPQQVHAALETIGRTSQPTAFIGDHIADVAAAPAAGVVPLAVATARTPRRSSAQQERSRRSPASPT